MELSFYQIWKRALLETTHIHSDAVHVYLGIGALLFALVVLKRPIYDWKALVPGLVLSLAMEVVDLWDFYRVLDQFRWQASIHDLINTNMLPVLLVCAFRFRWATLDGRTMPSPSRSQPKANRPKASNSEARPKGVQQDISAFIGAVRGK